MSSLSGGDLNFTSSDELKAWLLTQPPELHGVIAARAALRVLPTLHRHSRQEFGQWRFQQLIFGTFSDLPWLGLRPYIRAAPKTFAVTAAPTSVAFPILPPTSRTLTAPLVALAVRLGRETTDLRGPTATGANF